MQSYLQFDYAEALLEAAIAGAGIIQAPKYIVAPTIEQGKLQPILTNYTSKEGTVIAIVYPQKSIYQRKSAFLLIISGDQSENYLTVLRLIPIG